MTAADVAEVVIIAAMIWFVWQCGYWWRGRNDRKQQLLDARQEMGE